MGTFVGIMGASLILALFLLNQFNVIKNDNVWYDAGNVLGSGILIWYAFLLGSLPFIILNAVWFLVSFADTVKDIRT